MNHQSNNSSIDWLELDRLVDGRLNEEEYCQLLCQIDTDPDGWKQCALAFLEHQALEKELGAFAADPSCDLMPHASSDAATMVGVESRIPVESKSTSIFAGTLGWLSMAACVFAGLGIGFLLNGKTSPRVTTMPAGVNTAEITDPSPSMMAQQRQVPPKQQGNRVFLPKESKPPCQGNSRCRSQFSLEQRKRTIDRFDACEDECPMFRSIEEAGEEE